MRKLKTLACERKVESLEVHREDSDQSRKILLRETVCIVQGKIIKIRVNFILSKNGKFSNLLGASADCDF